MKYFLFFLNTNSFVSLIFIISKNYKVNLNWNANFNTWNCNYFEKYYKGLYEKGLNWNRWYVSSLISIIRDGLNIFCYNLTFRTDIIISWSIENFLPKIPGGSWSPFTPALSIIEETCSIFLWLKWLKSWHFCNLCIYK